MTSDISGCWMWSGTPTDLRGASPVFRDGSFLAWRSAAGLSVCQRYCSHAGADLAEATVLNDRIVCPYHGYSFDHLGLTADHAPALATMHSHELLGQIMVWLGSAETPDWHPPEGTALVPSGWAVIEDRQMELNASLGDIIENVADVEHFVPVHRAYAVPSLDSVETLGHVLRIESHHTLPTGSRFKLVVSAHGPGIMISEFGRGPWLRAIALQSPVSPRVTDVRFIVCAPEWVLTGKRGEISAIAMSLAEQLSTQLLEDNAIWKARNSDIDRRATSELSTIRQWLDRFSTSSGLSARRRSQRD